VIASAQSVRRLPLIPTPFLDETLSSWLFRAAANYHLTTREFAKGLIALEGQSLPRNCDFDAKPPEGLMTALAKYSGFRRSELDRLIVSPAGSTLGPEQRDAYCPKCFVEDREQGIVYFRRAWLDAWTLTCERHHCLLGRFEPFEYRQEAFDNVRAIFPQRGKAYRRNPSVEEVKLPRLLGELTLQPVLDVALLEDMLKSLAGRDLLLVMGSEAASDIVYDLTGAVRLRSAVWHDSSGVSCGPPELEQPLGDIRLRILSAYFASLLWQAFCGAERPKSPPALIPESSVRTLLAPLIGRWPRDDRRRLVG